MNRALAALFGTGFGYSACVIVRAVRPGDRTSTPARTDRLRSVVDVRGLSARWKHLLLAVLAGIAVAMATGWPVMLAVVPAAIWWLPSALGPDRDTQAWIDRAEACAGFAESLRDTIAAASGLQQAVTAAAAVPPLAIAGPLCTLSDDLRLGVRLAPALVKLADTLADPIADRICATLIHASSRPARNLAPVLGMLASDAREQALAMRVMMAERSRTQTAVRTIVGVITGVITILMTLDAAYLDPFGTVLGQLDIAVAAGLFAVGFVWLRRMSRPILPHRFLTRLDRLDTKVGLP